MDKDTIVITLKGKVETLPLAAKEFKTGSRGFYASGKVLTEDGKRYQVSCNMVEIGSKPGKKKA